MEKKDDFIERHLANIKGLTGLYKHINEMKVNDEIETEEPELTPESFLEAKERFWGKYESYHRDIVLYYLKAYGEALYWDAKRKENDKIENPS